MGALLSSLVVAVGIAAWTPPVPTLVPTPAPAQEPDGGLRSVSLTPPGYDPETPAPMLLALPPGSQDQSMVQRGLELYFEAEAARRGWIVVSPSAPQGRSFFEGDGPHQLPAFLDELLEDFNVEGGRVHVAGVSRGGLSAFQLAAVRADRIASLTVLPGATDDLLDEDALRAIAGLPVMLYVGADDTDWVGHARRAQAALTAVGAADVQLHERMGEGHVLDSALSVELFDRLDVLRAAEADAVRQRAHVSEVLDRLHEGATTADFEGYFGLFTPDAVFIGTDASERWSLAEFRAYSRPHFQGESAWTYESIERHVVLARDGQSAWFDERLMNAKYGETRGSGVLVRRGDSWKIAHYVLSFPIPNDAAADVVELLRR